MLVFRRLLPFFAAPLLIFAGCAPKISTPLPGGDFLRAAQNRMAEPEFGASLSGTPQPAYIDVSALATRLPSWKLAATLEKNGEDIHFSAINAPEAPRTLQIQSLPPEKSPSSLPRPASEPPGESDELVSGAPAFERAPLRVTARDAVPLENQGRQRQEGTLESFLADVARQQDANRTDDKMRLRAELEDEIEASQRLALARLEPLLPPPATQLEMTNLRIRLMANSPGTEAEKKQAASRLAELEAQWRTQLRTQANTRFEELRHLLTEVPVEKREVGFKEIEKTLTERRIQDESLRKLVEGDLRERISAGFGAGDMTPFSIQLPGVKLPPQTLGSVPLAPATAPPSLFNNQINSNTTLFWPSAAAFAGKPGPVSSVPPRNVQPLTAIQKRAAALRQQALKEASRWAKSIAKRRNWALQDHRTGPNGLKVPDRTRVALQLLNL